MGWLKRIGRGVRKGVKGIGKGLKSVGKTIGKPIQWSPLGQLLTGGNFGDILGSVTSPQMLSLVGLLAGTGGFGAAGGGLLSKLFGGGSGANGLLGSLFGGQQTVPWTNPDTGQVINFGSGSGGGLLGSLFGGGGGSGGGLLGSLFGGGGLGSLLGGGGTAYGLTQGMDALEDLRDLSGKPIDFWSTASKYPGPPTPAFTDFYSPNGLWGDFEGYTRDALGQEGGYSPSLMARLRSTVESDTNRAYNRGTSPGVFGGSIADRNRADSVSRNLLDLEKTNEDLGFTRRADAARLALAGLGQQAGDFWNYSNLLDRRYWSPLNFGYQVGSDERENEAAALAGEANFWGNLMNAGSQLMAGRA